MEQGTSRAAPARGANSTEHKGRLCVSGDAIPPTRDRAALCVLADKPLVPGAGVSLHLGGFQALLLPEGLCHRTACSPRGTRAAFIAAGGAGIKPFCPAPLPAVGMCLTQLVRAADVARVLFFFSLEMFFWLGLMLC